MSKRNFKFSVIIPIYNVEQYLEETIESVLNQTMDFKKNIEIILVNDGSPDNSEAICLRYKEEYPDNIKYIKQENAGVSAARNNGLHSAEGEHINFLDSDDIWENDVFEKAYHMFRKNPDIDIIGVRQKYFEAQENYPSLDFKFEGDRIVDITKNYQWIQLSVTSAFFRKSAIQNAEFDTRIKYSEDAKFIYEVMIQNKDKTYGIISSSLHNYRKRASGNSAIQTKDYKIDWYQQTVELSYLYLLEKCKSEFPEIIKTIEYYIAYDYQWRLKFDFLNETLFTEEEKQKYIDNTIKLFQNIDDQIILEQEILVPIYQLYAFKIKYGSFEKATEVFFEKSKQHLLSIELVEENKDFLQVEGSLKYIYNENIKFYYKIVGSNEYKEVPISKNLYESYTNLTNDSFSSIYVSMEIPLTEQIVEFFIEYKGKKKLLDLSFGVWSKLTMHKRSYHNLKKYTITKNSHQFIIRRRSFFRTLKLELFYHASMFVHGKFKSSFFRMGHFLIKPFIRKQIWIITDRELVAGDNGEALFKYLSNTDHKKIKVYFAIEKKSKDVKRLKSYGKVLYFHTYYHNLMISHCSKLISSHADSFIYNPLGKGGGYMRDLYHYQYIFLQHGITKNDVSSWLNRFSRNFSLFIVAAHREFNDILKNPKYGYNEDVVKLTGFARYDSLKQCDEIQKTIMLAPTWRAYLVGDVIGGTQQRKYSEEFKKSSFCKFYRELLNDKELLEMLEKYGYKIRLCLHPSLKSQIRDFQFDNPYIDVVKEINYNREFQKNSLLITDYSSIAFDFSYLKKPMIYNTFDEEEFYSHHIYSKGDFSVEKDGFGPEVKSVEDLKRKIEYYLMNECQIEPKYADRIDSFFKYHDQENCKRIYEEILRLDKKDV